MSLDPVFVLALLVFLLELLDGVPGRDTRREREAGVGLIRRTIGDDKVFILEVGVPLAGGAAPILEVSEGCARATHPLKRVVRRHVKESRDPLVDLVRVRSDGAVVHVRKEAEVRPKLATLRRRRHIKVIRPHRLSLVRRRSFDKPRNLLFAIRVGPGLVHVHALVIHALRHFGRLAVEEALVQPPRFKLAERPHLLVVMRIPRAVHRSFQPLAHLPQPVPVPSEVAGDHLRHAFGRAEAMQNDPFEATHPRRIDGVAPESLGKVEPKPTHALRLLLVLFPPLHLFQPLVRTVLSVQRERVAVWPLRLVRLSQPIG
mmetsp:Transcript_29865/g.97259  ORF Transcript_29865/g.97259 Transcript_29865/m.97259 type:complete len:316 (+) Transcript_29865:1149-2096(+)